MKLFWKIYFVLFLILVVGLLLSTPGDETTTTLTYIDIAISLPSVVALYGWAWGKQIISKNVWLIYASTFIILDLVYNLFFDKGNKDSWNEALIGLVLVIPSYIATVLYATRFNKLKG